jgi:putative redox protein
MTAKRIFFTNQQGFKLSAHIDIPESPRAFALYAHCFTCSKNLKSIVRISRTCRESNIAVCRFDFTGIAESEGEFSDTTLSSNVQDVLDAADYCAQEFAPIDLLIGHSLGGAAAILASEKIPSVKGLVTIAAPSEPSHLGTLLGQARQSALKNGTAQVKIGGNTYRLTREFFEDLEQNRISQVLKRHALPILIMHSPKDQTVLFEHAETLFSNASHPKSLISLGNADHILSDEKDAIYTGRIIATWIERYL